MNAQTDDLFATIAVRFWPDLEHKQGLQRLGGISDVIGVLYAIPLAIAGFVWLISLTNVRHLVTNWLLLLLFLALHFAFEKLDFFFFSEIAPGTYFDWHGSLSTFVEWSALLLLGPCGLWPGTVYLLIVYGLKLSRASLTSSRWHISRNFGLTLNTSILPYMIALQFYYYLGGTTPLPGLIFDRVWPVFIAIFLEWCLSIVLWLPLLVYYGRANEPTSGRWWLYVRSLLLAMGGSLLFNPFAVLAAGLYVQDGLGWYLFFISGLLLVGWLAQRLSQAVERSHQRERELRRLEELGRALSNVFPDAGALPGVLKEYIAHMFTYNPIEIRVFPDRVVLRQPEEQSPVPELAWAWVQTLTKARYFLSGDILPWSNQPAKNALIIAPILDIENSTPLGGVYLNYEWALEPVVNLIPAVQSLAAQLASALHNLAVYEQTLTYQKLEQELSMAGEIQASFLPTELPRVDGWREQGWQMAVTLSSARETSGDFFDIMGLPNERLGFLVADVADKGMGAALYMALSRTLIRTYAYEYPASPEQVLAAANDRILQDTHADLFVTAFYGVLNPVTGELIYCNAGHNGPLLLNKAGQETFQELKRTGIPLGIFEDETWEQGVVHLDTGDMLVIYTDGIIDASNKERQFFGRERLLECVQDYENHSAQEMLDTLLEQVRDFVGDAPQFDDITLMVITRGA